MSAARGDNEFPDLSKFDAGSLEDLTARQENLPNDAAINDAKAAAARRKASQTHKFRESLFSTVRWALIATLAASVAVMGVYMGSQWGEIEPAVIISFNAAVVVNTVGLAYIVANYLFPKGGGD
jgi:hypothetical protein